MTNNIVTVNVSQQIPPAPSLLQRTGAMISQGGTTYPTGSLGLLTQLSDLTSHLSASVAITSMALSAGTVTVATTAPHGWTTGDVVYANIAGVAPTAYNGIVQITITGASGFTYPLGGSPGSVTIQGTVTLFSESEILAMATSFFAQGSNLSVYVIELGEGTAVEGIASLTTWLTNNPLTVYSFLVPYEWDNVTQFKALASAYENTTAKLYFFTTTTPSTYTGYNVQQKSIFPLVPAPAVISGFYSPLALPEFTSAVAFFNTLNYNPSSTNKVTPLSFAYEFDVTPYPLPSNQPLLAQLKAASTNYIDTGAEGGISNTILKWGTLRDGNPWNYWYSIDWLDIQAQIALANAVINGSNNPLAPLYYDQPGINTLQGVLAGVVQNGVTYGLAAGAVKQVALSAAEFTANFEAGLYLGQLVINAEPFLVYTAENSGDFAIGKYAGFAVTWTPARGFTQIIVSITATNFV